MLSIRKFAPALALGLLCATSALAQSAPDGNRAHQWMDAHKGDMAAWHARMCTDGYARHVGMIAYLGAKLNLSDSQRAAFENWKTAVLGSAQQREQACLAHAPDMNQPHTILDREAHMRAMLESRLAAMDAQKPALEALYQSLSPEQKTEFDHMGHEHGGGMHGMHGQGWRHDGQQGQNEQKG
jgi:hypothetical protein